MRKGVGPKPTKRAICEKCSQWFVMAAKTFKQPCPDCWARTRSLKRYHEGKKRKKK